MRDSIRLVLAIACVASLAACGGGGTTGPLIAPDTNRVRVAVVDSGFKLDHPELQGTFSAAQEFASTGTIEDNVFRHGTYVAQVLAGNTVGATDNATLLLAKAADRFGDIYTNTILDATSWALNNGARVVNYSLAPVYDFIANDFLGQTFARALTSSGSLGAVMVMSAGNISPNGSTYNEALGNISTQVYSPGTFFGDDDRYNAISLIVGAIDASGNRQPYSFYPGEIAEVQSRFLVATAPYTVKSVSGTSDYSFNGTSATAPQVSAAAAEVLYRWPHLSAQQVSSILLATADRSFNPDNLYAINTCGSTGNINCGLYYFGQGKLDANKALSQPLGTTQLLSGASVGDGGYMVQSTALTLPAAFGDALHGQTLNAAMFDGYGRDFRFNLGSLIRTTQSAGPREWMQSLGERVHDHQQDQWQMRTAFSADGQLQSSRLAWGLGSGVHMHWQRGSGRGFDALAQDPSPLLSLASDDALRPYAALDRLGLRWQFHPRTAVEARSTIAHPGSASSSVATASAQRHEAQLAWQPSAGTRWRLGYAVTREDQALLGRSGQGALALDRSLAQAISLRLDHGLADQWRLFGAAELGALQVQGRTGYLQMDQATTSQWQAGLVWSDLEGRSQWALALSQPLRVEQAAAQFDLPVGRTLDGQVIRQRQSVSLAPSGRQLNLEMAWQQALGGRTGQPGTLGLHAIYAHDAGHMAGQRDWSLLGSYRLRW